MKKNVSGDVLGIYFREINKYPILKAKEQIEIVREIQKGNNQLKEKLIYSNLKFVVSIAKAYQYRGLPLLDLINEGNIGLIYSIKKFDYRKNIHFISYAVFWIKARIQKAIIDQTNNIRLPTNRNSDLKHINNYIKDIKEKENRIPTTTEVSKKLNLHEDVITNLLEVSQLPVLLNAPISENIKNLDVESKFSDTLRVNPSDNTINQYFKNDINNVLSSLKPQEAKIIVYRFGLNGNREHSLREIGDMYGLTKERIRQIQKIALEKLQHPKRKRILKDYYI